MTTIGAVQLSVITLLLLSTCSNVESYRILGLFPHPGLSHFHFFHPVMRTLAEAGHEVTVVSSFPNKEPIENYKDEAMNDEMSGLQNFMNLEVSSDVVSQLCQWIHSIVSFPYKHTTNISGSPIPNPMITCWKCSCSPSGE